MAMKQYGLGLKPFRLSLRIREDNRQSWLSSGVNNTAVQCACHMVSMTPLYSTYHSETSSRIIRHTVFFIRKSDSAAHDTAVQILYDTAVTSYSRGSGYLKGISIEKTYTRKLSFTIPYTVYSFRIHIQKDFNSCIRGLGELFDEKNRGRKSRVRAPLR
jgi:hypothetical protein